MFYDCTLQPAVWYGVHPLVIEYSRAPPSIRDWPDTAPRTGCRGWQAVRDEITIDLCSESQGKKT